MDRGLAVDLGEESKDYNSRARVKEERKRDTPWSPEFELRKWFVKKCMFCYTI